MAQGSENGSRTHEPSLRELTLELDGVRNLLTEKVDGLVRVLDERDRLYKERDDSRRLAVDAALAAAKEQTKQSFEASEKAIVKAEDAQREYNVRSNEFRGQLDDQAKTLMPRFEVNALMSNIEEKIRRVDTDLRGLRDARSQDDGRGVGSKAMWGYVTGAIGLILVLLSIFERVRVSVP